MNFDVSKTTLETLRHLTSIDPLTIATMSSQSYYELYRGSR
jgi:hypothetical protein